MAPPGPRTPLPAGTELFISLSAPASTRSTSRRRVSRRRCRAPLPVTAELRLDARCRRVHGVRPASGRHPPRDGRRPTRPLSLALDAITTHPDWTVELGAAPVDRARRWDRRGSRDDRRGTRRVGGRAGAGHASGCATMPAGRRRPPRTSRPGATWRSSAPEPWWPVPAGDARWPGRRVARARRDHRRVVRCPRPGDAPRRLRDDRHRLHGPGRDDAARVHGRPRHG